MSIVFKKTKILNTGSSLVEVMVAAAIMLVVMSGLYSTHTYFISQTNLNTQKIKADFLLEEGVEAVITMRDRTWSNVANLTAGTSYGLTFSSGQWATSTSILPIDSTFYRSFTVSNVSRNVNGDIVTSGGSNDVGTKKLTVTVAWSDHGATTTRSLSTYIANIL